MRFPWILLREGQSRSQSSYCQGIVCAARKSRPIQEKKTATHNSVDNKLETREIFAIGDGDHILSVTLVVDLAHQAPDQIPVVHRCNVVQLRTCNQ